MERLHAHAGRRETDRQAKNFPKSPCGPEASQSEHLTSRSSSEGIFVMRDLWFCGVFWPDDGDDVEAGGQVEFVVKFEPGEGGAGESQLAAAVDGFEGLAIVGGRAGFDFGEDGGGAIFGDDVDFPEAVADASIDDAPAEFSEV